MPRRGRQTVYALTSESPIRSPFARDKICYAAFAAHLFQARGVRHLGHPLARGGIMKKFVLIFAAASAAFAFQTDRNPEVARWEQQARNVTIIRDDWGIAHVYGKTDADAVFGMEYAQAEDDFNRVETNYINAMGRLAEAEGESKIYQDLRMKLFIDPGELKKQYAASPAWLQTLMNAFADGLNFYLYKHPEVKPRVITQFEPWMALSFTEGSIGGDIEKVNLNQLASVLRQRRRSEPRRAANHGRRMQNRSRGGSNGMAIAPSNTAGPPRPAADQSAHIFLFPLRTANGERRRAERLRRRDLGPIFHLSGIQRSRRLDAHLQRRGCRG